MKPDEQDKLWELLGKTRQPSVSPFFARNVLRAVRQEVQEGGQKRPLLARLTRALHRWSWQIAAAGVCAIAVLVTVSPTAFVRHHHSAPAQPSLDTQIVANPDYEVIVHLDELAADEESSLWLDDPAHSVN